MNFINAIFILFILIVGAITAFYFFKDITKINNIENQVISKAEDNDA